MKSFVLIAVIVAIVVGCVMSAPNEQAQSLNAHSLEKRDFGDVIGEILSCFEFWNN